MFVKMDCVVAELSATIDWSVTDFYKTESELKTPERRSVILAELKWCGLIRSQAKILDQIKWLPSNKLSRYFGVERHGLPDVLGEVELPDENNSRAEYSNQVKVYCSRYLEDNVGWAVSLFAMYRFGLIEYLGFEQVGCQWKAKPDFEERYLEMMKLEGVKNVVEIVGKNGSHRLGFWRQ
jgi:hypothetical protein